MGIARDDRRRGASPRSFGDVDERALLDEALEKKLRGGKKPLDDAGARAALPVPDAPGLHAGRRVARRVCDAVAARARSGRQSSRVARTIDRCVRAKFAAVLPRSTSSSTATASSPSSPLVPARRPDAALHQRRDEPVQGRVPRPGDSATTRARPRRRSACASAASTTTSTTSGRRCAITRSSRCSATSRSATTSSRTRSRSRGSC